MLFFIGLAIIIKLSGDAAVVELADASDSKSDGSDTVWVQVPLSPPEASVNDIYAE